MKKLFWIGLFGTFIAITACKKNYVCDYGDLLVLNEDGEYDIDTSLVSLREVRFDLTNKEAQEARLECEDKGGEWYRHK